jgi:rfaE bifunctional protein nucleotidyltransferase chain/domain
MGKVVTRDQLLREVVRWRSRTEFNVVFTNGCFDILHLGHLATFSLAASYGEFLVVGVNSDESVVKSKLRRPIMYEEERVAIVSALQCVTFATIFNEPTPLELIKAIMPNVLIKGSDWGDNIVGSDEVRAAGGMVVSAPTLDKSRYSSSAIIERIRRRVL